MTIAEACEAFLRDLDAQGLSRSTRRGYEIVFRQLQEFAAERNIKNLEQVDVGLLRSWRESWDFKTASKRTWLAKTKSFFRFAVDAELLERSPAAKLRAPKDDTPPTQPLSADEVRATLVASRQMPKERS